MKRLFTDKFLKTVASSRYPLEVQTKTTVVIQLANRYPLQEPTANIITPIYHPNVYSSGKICFGQKWLPTEGLDLLVKRIVKIVTYDPAILNGASPANREALSWYNSAIKAHPSAFPTDDLLVAPEKNEKTMNWNAIQEEKVIVKCTHCSSALRLPKGNSGTVKCPVCSKFFEART